MMYRHLVPVLAFGIWSVLVSVEQASAQQRVQTPEGCRAMEAAERQYINNAYDPQLAVIENDILTLTTRIQTQPHRATELNRQLGELETQLANLQEQKENVIGQLGVIFSNCMAEAKRQAAERRRATEAEFKRRRATEQEALRQAWQAEAERQRALAAKAARQRKMEAEAARLAREAQRWTQERRKHQRAVSATVPGSPGAIIAPRDSRHNRYTSGALITGKLATPSQRRWGGPGPRRTGGHHERATSRWHYGSN